MQVRFLKMSRLRRFTHTEDGAITAFGLILTIALIGVGGLGLDYANGIMVRTHLQIAADSAAHAAIVARETQDEATAKQIALDVAHKALPAGKFGDTITADDIEFGTWDPASGFTPDAGARSAVRVNTARLVSRANGVSTFFLRFVGINTLDVVRQSVFQTYYPTCFREGFVAENRVDVQSNNTYGNGFCIHSNDHVEINNGNTFMEGTIVSMPDERDLVVPSSGADSNPGLSDALRSGAYRLRILAQMDAIIAGVEDPNSPYFRTDYVDINPFTEEPQERVTLRSNGGGVRIDDWVSGAVHELNCNAPNRKVNFGNPNDVFQRGVMVTNCIIQFASNVALEDIIIINKNTDEEAFSSPASFTLGRDDGCAPGGGAQLVTLGGMKFAADLNVYGGQMIAAKTVQFAARPDGIEGISILSGDQIDGSSLINVGFCGGMGMDNNFMAEYFRLAS